MPYPLSSKTAIPLFFIILIQYVSAQQKPLKTDSALYYSKIQFIQQASSVIEASLKEEQWSQIAHFSVNWKISGSACDELLFSINTLLAIQNNQYAALQLPCDFLYYLEDYAREMEYTHENTPSFRYRIKLSAKYWYDATADVKKLFPLLQSWSQRLQSTRRLNGSELFFCRVFSGAISHPRSAFQSDRKNYPDLDAFEHRLENNNSLFFASQRSRNIGTAGIMTGSWLPTGNLRTLGTHPSVGLLLGSRNKKNEYDIIWNFRFLNPTPHTYHILRNDSSYSSNYYDGGYIGLDYTRYIVHKTKYELGLTSGMGYDYFSVADGFGSSGANSVLEPFNVGSFDFSNGIRFKYFLGPKTYIGIAAKYHLINYCNSGGTDLGGKAFTIDLIFGSH